jgi:signal transduction histidine kinase
VDFIHRLLILPAEEQPSLDGLLDELATAFGANAAGLATFPEAIPLCYSSVSSPRALDEAFPPWSEQFDLTEHLPHLHTALTLPRRAGGSCLLTLMGTPECGAWMLWLEEDDRTFWSESDAVLLTMVCQALTHRLTRDERATPWAVQLDRSIRRMRMDTAARIVRRLSHDFGNILTGILGFGELALAHPTASNSPLYDFLSEVHRAAKSGTQYINQLRLLSRRQPAINRSCSLADVLAEARREWRATSTDVRLQVHLPEELPAVTVGADELRQVLAIVLENAREAIVGAGVIEISAQTIEVIAEEAGRLVGNVRSGTHVEICIADNGSGLTSEAQRKLFTEPFFSTRPRNRGFGLAMAYGILAAHRGGIELLPRPAGGTTARLLLPVAASTAPAF